MATMAPVSSSLSGDRTPPARPLRPLVQPDRADGAAHSMVPAIFKDRGNPKRWQRRVRPSSQRSTGSSVSSIATSSSRITGCQGPTSSRAEATCSIVIMGTTASCASLAPTAPGRNLVNEPANRSSVSPRSGGWHRSALGTTPAEIWCATETPDAPVTAADAPRTALSGNTSRHASTGSPLPANPLPRRIGGPRPSLWRAD